MTVTTVGTCSSTQIENEYNNYVINIDNTIYTMQATEIKVNLWELIKSTYTHPLKHIRFVNHFL